MAIASGIPALFIFQPSMLEFVAWPVLIFFLGTLFFSMLALYALVQLARNPSQRKWIWFAVGAAYASTHCTGLGLINVLATAAVLGIFVLRVSYGRLPQFLDVRRTIIIALVTLAVVALLHVLCMQLFRTPPAQGAKTDYLNVWLALGLIAAAFFSAAQALIVFRFLPAFHSEVIMSLWPWSVFLIVLVVIFLVILVRQYQRAPNTGRLVQLVLHSFSIVAFASFLFLGLTRSVAEPDENWMLGYIIASRYLVMANFALFGSFTGLAILLAGKLGKFCAVVFVMLGLVSLVANKQYARSAFPDVQSTFTVSHGRAWRTIVSMARQCRAANLPVPDVPMKVVSEFPWPLHYYESLLRYSLKLKPDEKIDFVQWNQLDATTHRRYETAAPSIREAFKLLKVTEN